MTQRPTRLDPTGFPMVWLPTLGLYVHWLPVTKIQFEHFLCDALDGHFDSPWYEEVLRLNPRITARRIWRGNYWQAFTTGVLPSEAERFAAWCGEGYRLPTRDEWTRAYLQMKVEPEGEPLPPPLLDSLRERPRELLDRVVAAAREASVSFGFNPGSETSLLFRFGILEWVALEGEAPARWGGIGEPNPAFHGNLLAPEQGEIVLPERAETERLPPFGFRLVFDPRQARSAATGEAPTAETTTAAA
jgi:Sulfatase-modifying factor enzyme 1